MPYSTACNYASYSWIRGDTYYFAGSDTSYTEGCIRNVSGTTGTITIKKASPSDHGTDSGWQSSYGSKQAQVPVFGNWVHDVTFDGSYKYGFKITSFLNTYDERGNVWRQIIRNVEVTEPTPSDNDYIYIYSRSSGDGSLSNPDLLIEDAWFHDLGTVESIYYVTGEYGIIQNSIFERTLTSNNTNHKTVVRFNGTVNHVIFRNNTISDWCGYSITSPIELEGSGTTSYIWIYNNVLYLTPGYCSGKSEGSRAIDGLGAGTFDHIYIDNNDLINIDQDEAADVGLFGAWSNSEVKNNIWYNSPGLRFIGSAGVTKDYNFFYQTPNYSDRQAHDVSGTADPFVDSTNYNFNLKNCSGPSCANDNGLNLSSIFSTDLLGTIRPQGLGWDIGAYEYITNTPPPPPDTTPPSPPSGVNVR